MSNSFQWRPASEALPSVTTKMPAFCAVFCLLSRYQVPAGAHTGSKLAGAEDPVLAKTFRVGFKTCGRTGCFLRGQQTSSQRDNPAGRMGPHPPGPCHSAQAGGQARSGDAGQRQLAFRSLGTFMVMKQVQGKAGKSVYRPGSNKAP